MTSTGFAGLGIVVLVAIFLVALAFIYRRSPFSFRNIPAFTRIRRSASLVVEDGTRLHISLGSGNILAATGASALAGLVLVRKFGEITSLSDRPPITTTGNGIINLLAQDTLRGAHETVSIGQSFDMNNARLAGFTPISYVAGVMPSMRDEGVSANVLIGNFGAEVGLLVEAADRQSAAITAASDNLTAQAVLFATTPDTLIGEELFAAGNYIQAGSTHSASLVVQDIMRWLIIIALVSGVLLKMAGLL